MLTNEVAQKPSGLLAQPFTVHRPFGGLHAGPAQDVDSHDRHIAIARADQHEQPLYRAGLRGMQDVAQPKSNSVLMLWPPVAHYAQADTHISAHS